MAVGLGRTGFEFVSLGSNSGVDLSMSESFLREAFDQRAVAPGDLPQPGRLHVARACGAELGSIRKLSKDILASPGRFAGARAIDFVASALLDAVVDAILVPSRRSGRVALRPALYQRLPLVRRAEEFMRANLGKPIMLHDICRAARASERTVEYAFCDIYGLGAKQFLRLLRLNRLRHELKALPVEAATVEDIASRCGLWHAGHFSTNYRRLFGETPQETRLSHRMGASLAVRI
jgi:AraC family ethanolamine operon transcriptional activator